MKVDGLCAAARRAASELGVLPRERKDAALHGVVEALERRAAEILRENDEDVRLARRQRQPDAVIDRLLLDEDRLAEMVAAVRAVAALPDPVGRVDGGWRLPNGLELRKVREPLGVVAVIYEARPQVTVAAAALCLKSGNAVLLRGGSAATHSNRLLAEVFQGAVIEAGLPRAAIGWLGPDRAELEELLRQRGVVDVVILRGGEALQDYVLEHSHVPVLYAAGGNCHVYVDASADVEMATRIITNAKCQRPDSGNAVETVLVHADAAPGLLPSLVGGLKKRGVDLVVDKATTQLLGDDDLKRANRTHYETEFLSLKVAVHIVAGLDEALEHISTYGTRHSEAIVTSDLEAARRFTREVDAACVYVNASTRFTDGAEFGLGAEMGVSTQKLHARGPIGLEELTCVKYVLWGEGQIRG